MDRYPMLEWGIMYEGCYVSDNLSIFDNQHIIMIGADRPKHMLSEEASQMKIWDSDYTGQCLPLSPSPPIYYIIQQHFQYHP